MIFVKKTKSCSLDLVVRADSCLLRWGGSLFVFKNLAWYVWVTSFIPSDKKEDGTP